MPLLRFDLIEGRSREEVKQLLDAAHRAVIRAFDVPARDRYQIVHQHPAHELVIEDSGLGFSRSKDLVIISIISRRRTIHQKETLFQYLAEELEKHCGIRADDLFISIVENGVSDWSFGRGEAQFLTGKL
ncbi:tautomerase family protein [Sporolactobacillus sp. Y61]|jgi:hypothetical protein|uniref:Tautomerase family protein n=1 Tax=Sporolactobacillus sp. Y61 TaxID=3160863 RepID=A0AAU8IIN0_9BACL|nr:tautomerase family protein [Sporolactobacillus sp. THM19-2]RYL94043.1 tautomerase family protein [Sporolactobacillus sp. THM19-2]